MTNRAPLIVAILLLLLPVLYVGSYLALVTPEGTFAARRASPYSYAEGDGDMLPYRVGSRWASAIFWPLEQIDRKVRPGKWPETPWE